MDNGARNKMRQSSTDISGSIPQPHNALSSVVTRENCSDSKWANSSTCRVYTAPSSTLPIASSSPLTAMTEPGGESCEELLNLLHQRLIATGEWSSLLGSLRGMLEEDGWDTRLREHAESMLWDGCGSANPHRRGPRPGTAAPAYTRGEARPVRAKYVISRLVSCR